MTCLFYGKRQNVNRKKHRETKMLLSVHFDKNHRKTSHRNTSHFARKIYIANMLLKKNCAAIRNRPFYKQNFFEKMTKYNNFSIESKGNHPSDLPGQTVLPSVMAIQLSSCTRNNSLAGSSKKSESPPPAPPPCWTQTQSLEKTFSAPAQINQILLSPIYWAVKRHVFTERLERGGPCWLLKLR